MKNLHKAFTLIELLVVIGILGILMGTLIASLSGSGDSAKAAKCMANMRNLAVAVQAYGVADAHFPHAGSVTRMQMDTSKGQKRSRAQYQELKGWVSWNSKGMFKNGISESKQSPEAISMYESDRELGRFAVTNGALWRYVGGDSSLFVCPVHAKQTGAHWSYLMNAYFGWSASEGHAYSSNHYGIRYDSLTGTDRILLFAEVPFQGAGEWFPDKGASGTDGDGILQYVGCSKAKGVAGPGCQDGEEHIGANHKVGKDWYAHVVFADGHAEKLRCSTSKGELLGGNEMRELTTFLCTGKSFTFTGKRYEELK